MLVWIVCSDARTRNILAKGAIKSGHQIQEFVSEEHLSSQLEQASQNWPEVVVVHHSTRKSVALASTKMISLIRQPQGERQPDNSAPIRIYHELRKLGYSRKFILFDSTNPDTQKELEAIQTADKKIMLVATSKQNDRHLAELLTK